ncbi:MAG: ABC transporter permease [Chloroflexota bacterium]|nr:ABC transporter permease [Chloroflexota bacterium]
MGDDLGADLDIYRRLAGARLRAELQYRASFALQTVGNFLVQLAELAALLILFRHVETLGGWTAGEVAFLYGLSGLSFGIAHTLASGFSAFSQLIVRGGFDRLLVRPVGAMLQVLAEDIQLRRLGQAIQGGAALVVAARLVDVEWTAGRALYLPIVLLSATLLFAALFALEATLCFWTTEATEIINAFTYGGSDVAQYPLHIFDTGLRRFFLFVVPVGFVVYAPALYLLDKPDPLGLPTFTRFVAPAAALLFACLAGAAWHLGVRHYRSTGT